MANDTDEHDPDALVTAEEAAASRAKNDHKGLKIFILVVVLGALAVTLGPVLYSEHQLDQVLADGAPAVGTLLEVTDTGNRYNHDAEVEMRFRVEREGERPYEARVTWVPSQVDLLNYPVGTVCDLRVDREDPQKIAVVGPQRERSSPPDPG